jgi:hypothetical protein
MKSGNNDSKKYSPLRWPAVRSTKGGELLSGAFVNIFPKGKRSDGLFLFLRHFSTPNAKKALKSNFP